MEQVRRFVHDDQAQDLVEYTLLLAFICLAALPGMIINFMQGLQNIWGYM